MGESAGGGSLVHHLTAFGGKQPPLFKRAVIQSSGFSVKGWDRKGGNEDTFQTFLTDAGCAGQGIECLRAASFAIIKAAQTQTINNARQGTFGFSPSVDGKWVRQLPQLELVSGNYFKGLESLIVTHVTDEAGMFTNPKKVYNDTNFKDYINWQFGNNSAVTKALFDYYQLDRYNDARSRLMDYTSHSSFTCTARYLASAYPNSTYMAQFEGNHGSDILADFFDTSSTTGKLDSFFAGSNAKEKYQGYLASYASSGDPNKFKFADTPAWEKIKFGEVIGGVLEVTNRFKLINDFQTTKNDCDILTNVFAAVTAENGKCQKHICL
jgi:carboxylesterase type B